jgi:Flp pilus assembly protein TadD
VLIAVGAALSLLGTWRQTSRPGMRHYLRGMEFMTARYPVEAEQEWLRGVRADPSEYHCYEQLGEYYAAVMRPETAVEYYSRACRLAPRDGALFTRLAALERRIGRTDQARNAARRAYELLPNDADAAGAYGILLAESRNRPAALAVLRRAHALRPGDRPLFLAMVRTELDSLDFAGVERDLTPYLRSHPADTDACFTMALVYNQKPRTPENLRIAIDYARRALPGMPRDPRIYTLLGQLYLDSNQTAEALRIYATGHQAVPNAEGMLRGQADCYTRLGRMDKVASVTPELRTLLARHDRISYLTHRMGFNHHDTTAGLELARLVEKDGQFPKARAYYEQLVRQAPDDPRTRSALAGFYRRMGWPDRARVALQPQFIP